MKAKAAFTVLDKKRAEGAGKGAQVKAKAAFTVPDKKRAEGAGGEYGN